MKYLKMTLEYVLVKQKGKHFLTFFLYAVMPSVVLSYIFPPSHYIAIFANYNTPNFANFGRLWLPLFNHPIWTLIIFVCGLILLVFAIAAISSIIMRHFRVNDFSLPQLLISTDENFFPSFTAATGIILLALLFHTLSCSFIVLWYALKLGILGLILSVLSVAGLLSITLIIFSSMTMWFPIMSFTGISVFRALQMSFSKSHNHLRKLYLTNLNVLLFCIVFALLAWICRDISVLKIIFNAFTYIICITLIIPANFITYCDIEGVTREDLIQSPYKRR